MDTGNNRCVLVTGGRGFIGCAVGKLLQRAGYRVVSLDAAPLATSNTSRESVGQVQCDITDAKALRRVFESQPVGAVIHLAAVLPTAAQREPVRATQVNVEGSLQLMEIARRFGVQRFLFGSSLSVYGTCPADQIVSEADRAAPEDVYGAAKLYVEHLGRAYRESQGLEFVSLRIGRVVGEGARSTSSAWRSHIFESLAAATAIEIELPYIGSERILLVHVDDIAKMVVALMQASRPVHTVYNATCESVVVADLKRELERLNSNILVRLGEGGAVGNPRLLDSTRFQREFGFHARPIFEQLRAAARGI